MPRLDQDLENWKPAVGAYGFSATKVEELGATEYTLVTIAADASSSVIRFEDQIEKAIQEIIKSCKYSPRADNLMIRLVQFSSGVCEIHGFKLLEACNVDDYKNCLQVGGMTALYDATENSVMSTARYGTDLMSKDFDANGIVFVITDGWENNSACSVGGVKEAFDKAMQNESLESMVSVLIGVNVSDPTLSQALNDFQKDAGFDKYIEADNATPSTLAKLAEFVSKSISAQSKSLGSGTSAQLPQSLSI